jgi:hypothetical protein
MTYVLGHGPDCQGIEVVQYGPQRHDPQRYRCNHSDCPRHIFSSSTGTTAAFLRCNTRWWTWLSRAVGSAIPPGFYGAVQRPSSAP